MKKLWITLAIAGMFGFAACQGRQQEPKAEEPVIEEEVTEEEATEEDTFEVEEEAEEVPQE